LALGSLIVASLACQAVTEPTPTPVQPTLSAMTPTEAPTVQPAAAPTEVPTEVPTESPTEAPPATSPPAPTVTEQPAAPELAILFFIVDVEDVATGKRLTFNWQTTGAVRGTIWSGTSHRFFQEWGVPPNGTLTVELAGTFYRNPPMTLMAYDAAGNHVFESVTVEWACEYEYFFAPAPAACPRYEASDTWAAEQPFEHGRMIWLEEVHGEDFTLQRFILVLYDDGTYEHYEGTWTEGMPESDPAIVPPAGLLQPIRGFGKLWRENTGVRDGLGWATAPEQGFTTTWQEQTGESLGQGKAFMRIFSDQIAQINSWDVRTGTWQFLAP